MHSRASFQQTLLLALPVIGALAFMLERLFKRRIPAATSYALFILNTALYSYAVVSLPVLALFYEVFPYFFEAALLVLFRLNVVFIVCAYCLLAFSHYLGGAEQFIAYCAERSVWLRPLAKLHSWLLSTEA